MDSRLELTLPVVGKVMGFRMKITSIGAAVPTRPVEALKPVSRRRKPASESGDKPVRRGRAAAPKGQGELLDIEV